MFLVVSDASVLIDIEHGNLTKAMFSLPWKFVVPDVLFEEELSDRHGHLLEFGLRTLTMNADLVMEAYNLRQKFAKPSVNDLLALALARHENCQLLTGDKALREVAAVFNVEVHGTIWLVEQMINMERVAVDVAFAGFERMKKTGSRLPWGEVEKILRKNLVAENV